MLNVLKDHGYAEMKKRSEDKELWRKWMPKRTCQKTEN